MAGVEEETDVSKLRITNDDERKAILGSKVNRRSKRRRSSNKFNDKTNKPEVELPKKEKKRKSTLPPSLEFQDLNKNSRFNTLRDLALFILQANDSCPTFIKVNNRNLIQRVVFLIVPGLELTDFGVDEDPELLADFELKRCPEELTFVKNHFDKFLMTTAPGDRYSLYPLIKAFTSIPYTKKQKTKKVKELESKKLVLPDLLMTFEDFSENAYPIHPLVPNLPESLVTNIQDGWVDTVKFHHEGSHVFALDCEMCETSSGKVLTRISMINFDEEVILDEYVKPEEEITDYLTRYSGITEDLLKHVTTTLKDIQDKISKIISADDILIGHSIENDLNVLKIRHPRIIDTSLIFEHPRGPPFKSSLKYLANQFLQRTIQEGEHDSVEDSKTCLDLIKLKLVNNALLGKVVDGESLFKVLGDVDKKAVILDYLRVQNDQKKYIQCFNDDELSDLVIKKSADTDLIVAKFKDIESQLGWDKQPSDEDTNGEIEDDVKSNVKKNAFKALNIRLEKIYKNLPENTAIILSTGYSNPCKLKSLGQQKRNFKKEYENKLYSEIESNWSSDDEASLKKHLKSARMGLAFLTIKTGDDSSVSSTTPKVDTGRALENNEEVIIEEDDE